MGLADEARKMSGTKGPACTVGQLLAKLDPKKRKELADALADDTVPTAGLRRAIIGRKWEPLPPRSALDRHRRGECKCD